MNIFMNIHFNIHSVFKIFRAFCLGYVVLQLLQGSKTPLETFSGVGGMFILLINYARSVGYIVFYASAAAYRLTFRGQ